MTIFVSHPLTYTLATIALVVAEPAFAARFLPLGGDDFYAGEVDGNPVRSEVVDGCAYAVSEDGRVVVGESKGEYQTPEAFRWNAESGIETFGQFGGGFHSVALDVSADGAVAVGWGEADVYFDGVYEPLGEYIFLTGVQPQAFRSETYGLERLNPPEFFVGVSDGAAIAPCPASMAGC